MDRWYAILRIGGTLDLTVCQDELSAYSLAEILGGHVGGEGRTREEAKAAAGWAVQ